MRTKVSTVDDCYKNLVCAILERAFLDLRLGVNRKLTLELLLDRCSVELLVDEGRYSITNLAFPEQGPEHTLRAELTTGAVVADAEWHLLTPGK